MHKNENKNGLPTDINQSGECERHGHKGGISRRGFLKGMGTGIAGSYMLSAGAAVAKTVNEKMLDSTEGETEKLSFNVNGRQFNLYIRPGATLVEVLREKLGLMGTKVVCNQGECGGCTVLLDDMAVYSCHILALDCQGREVTTIEGVMKNGKLSPVQEAFIEHDGLQCGFCTPGQIMAAEALLRKNAKPGRQEIIEAMSGNLCRCGAYPKILESVQAAAEKL